ncbi:MAG: cell division protein SepF [Oscillospiraceae bacterium]
MAMEFFGEVKSFISDKLGFRRDSDFERFEDRDEGAMDNQPEYTRESTVRKPEYEDNGYSDFEERPMGTGKVLNMNQGSHATKVFIVKAETYNTTLQNVITHIKQGDIVFLNLEDAQDGARTRIVDFVYGAVIALDGTIEKADTCSYLITPNGVSISGDAVKAATKNS